MFHKPWIAGADLQAQTVQIKIAVTTNQNIQNEAGKFSWLEQPLSSDAGGSSYSTELELPVDASNF